METTQGFKTPKSEANEDQKRTEREKRKNNEVREKKREREEEKGRKKREITDIDIESNKDATIRVDTSIFQLYSH